MSLNTPVTSRADYVAAGPTSATFPAIVAMAPGQFFLYACTVASWIAQGGAPVAAAAAGSTYVPANTYLVIRGDNGAKLAVIQDAIAGKASLTPCQL